MVDHGAVAARPGGSTTRKRSPAALCVRADRSLAKHVFISLARILEQFWCYSWKSAPEKRAELLKTCLD